MTNDFIMQMKPWFGAEEKEAFILYGRKLYQSSKDKHF